MSADLTGPRFVSLDDVAWCWLSFALHAEMAWSFDPDVRFESCLVFFSDNTGFVRPIRNVDMSK